MRALKTIVATAVIVFTMSTVAMAGVQRLTGQDDAAGDTSQAVTRQTSTMRLTDLQVNKLAAALVKAHAAVERREARHDREQKAVYRSGTRHQTARHHEAETQVRTTAKHQGAGSSGHHAEPAQTGTNHHASTGGSTGGGRSGGHHDGHGGGHD
jgi:hypothetical protein